MICQYKTFNYHVNKGSDVWKLTYFHTLTCWGPARSSRPPVEQWPPHQITPPGSALCRLPHIEIHLLDPKQTRFYRNGRHSYIWGLVCGSSWKAWWPEFGSGDGVHASPLCCSRSCGPNRAPLLRHRRQHPRRTWRNNLHNAWMPTSITPALPFICQGDIWLFQITEPWKTQVSNASAMPAWRGAHNPPLKTRTEPNTSHSIL